MLYAQTHLTLPPWIHSEIDAQRLYEDDEAKVALAIQLSHRNVEHGSGGPFGAAVFEAGTGRLVGVGTNGVIRLNNSCAHAEVLALMMAQAHVGSFTLHADGKPRHELFSSCEPCAMCLGATLWSGVSRLVFAAVRDDAARLSFDEGPVFPESYEYLEQRGLVIEPGLLRDEANAVFDLYLERGGPIYNR